MMTVAMYVRCMDDEARRDFEEHIVENIYDEFFRNFTHDTNAPVYADECSGEIICTTGEQAFKVKRLIEGIAGESGLEFGYYDPEADEESDSTDWRTGKWFVRVD